MYMYIYIYIYVLVHLFCRQPHYLCIFPRCTVYGSGCRVEVVGCRAYGVVIQRSQRLIPPRW